MDKGNTLESWKAIAAHLNRNIRTCQLWERELDLPIHRLDGSPKARVFAFRDEVDRWLDEKLHERERGAGAPGNKRRRTELPTLPAWNIGLIAGLAVLLVGAVAVAAWLIARQAKVRWANDFAVPEIERLLQTADRKTPFKLLLEAEKAIPRSPKFESLRPLVVCAVSFATEPAGAEIRLKDYDPDETSWILLGRSPLTGARTWQGYKRFKAEKAGYASVEGAFFARAGFDVEFKLELFAAETIPPGMVRIEGGRPMIHLIGLTHLDPVDLNDFYLDRFEVTNKQYEEFVRAGGYLKREFWKNAFVREGKTLPWDEGIREFVDSTGRPGPATWKLGRYPEGQADYPVSGVSWYEAAAYAAFAGKRLPSCYHWVHAVGDNYIENANLIPASNLEGRGPAQVGSFQGMSPTGVYDLAGNVKEWCSNDFGGKRLALGGSWNEFQYVLGDADRYPPLTRVENFGFRCMADIPGGKDPGEAHQSIKEIPPLDFWAMKPCSEEVFAVFRRLYEYTKTPLDAKIESRTEWSEDTTIEKVSFRDASGEDRMPVYLFLPRKGRPPFQTVVYYPGDGAWYVPSIFDYGLVKNREVELFTKNGRVLVFPVYQGTFERQLTRKLPTTPQRRRDAAIGRFRDLARSLDYLETRPDINMDKLGYHGLSGGGGFGVVFAALEKRLKAAALLGGGLYWVDYVPHYYAPERDFVHFAPRVHIPVLMQNGRYDFLMPWESSIKRLFALLGTPPGDKKLIGYESGHSVWLVNEYRKDMFDFFDRYLGPVKKSP